MKKSTLRGTQFKNFYSTIIIWWHEKQGVKTVASWDQLLLCLHFAF